MRVSTTLQFKLVVFTLWGTFLVSAPVWAEGPELNDLGTLWLKNIRRSEQRDVQIVERLPKLGASPDDRSSPRIDASGTSAHRSVSNAAVMA